MNNLLFFS